MGAKFQVKNGFSRVKFFIAKIDSRMP